MADMYRNFKFEVEIDGFTRAGFAKVSGLKQSTEVIEYREGGENETPHKMPGQTSFEALTLERGKSTDEDFLDWSQQIFSLDKRDGNQGDDLFRRQVVVHLKDKSGTRVRKWTVSEAWPSEYETGELDASGNDVLIDKIILQNEGIKEEAV